MLELRQIALRYADFTLTADLRVGPGQEVSIIGPSGAGKSTLLAAIAGFETVTTGQILLNGQDITARRPADRAIAMLFQDNNLFPQLSAFDNVALGLAATGRLTAAQRDRVMAALHRVGLGDMAARRPGSLSGGQQGRVAIARLLVQDRALVLLDEPFAALGPALRRDMLSLLRQVTQARGATLLLVTHDAAEARALPQTILVDAGHVHPPMATGDLFAAPPASLRDWLGADQPGQARPAQGPATPAPST